MIALVPTAASHAVRAEPAPATQTTTRATDDAVVALIASCERYAASYAGLHHRPIGCDPALGPILLDVLRGIAALTGDGALRDQVFEVISDHALDLEE
ncbi:MAG: hypothetical protein ABIY55_25935 [Kofleriaceae bacterium]